MTPFDAAFLALAAGIFLPRAGPQAWRRWLVALAPLLAFGLPSGPFQLLAAVAVCLATPRHAAAGLLLVLPTYPSLTQAVVTALCWTGGTWLLDGLEQRFREQERLSVSRQVMACGVLYLALAPLAHL